MSIVKEALAPCCKCGGQEKIKIYRSINTSDNPELRERVMNGSLFIWECPLCGQRNLARYETLYHDPERKLMAWILPDGAVSAAQLQAVSNQARAMGNYTLRLVDDMGSLMEKVLINDAGLSDVALEMCKYVTKMEIASKDRENASEIMSSHMHFYKVEGDVITFMYAFQGSMTGVNVGMNVYEDSLGIIRRNPSVQPEEGFQKIDSDWLLARMK
ncbi:MAG: hypothetical protein HUJ94_03355 [Bacteroidales bacterium]|nr:hypothetical protein [Bacteroidales bacterium]